MANPLLSKLKRGRRGQALVEYVLIVILVSLAVVAILTATGPAIGNVFSNTIYNLLQQTSTPYSTLNATDFWNYVTAVASYTPVIPGVVTNTPSGATPLPSPTSSSTTGPSPTNTNTPTPTKTVTPGPSPTLVDVAYTAPFTDTGDTINRWAFPFTDAWAALPWTVAYYNGGSWGNFTPGAPAYTTNYGGDVSYQWPGSPAAGVNPTGFTAVFTNSAPNSVPLEGRVYQAALIVGANDGAIFKINGTPIISIAPSANEQRQTVKVQRPAAGNYNIEVDFYGGGSPNSVQLVFSVLADTNTYPNGSSAVPNACKWFVSQPSRSPQLSWQDSLGNYNVNSACYLRLRGSIDIATLTRPRMIFWDTWALGPNAHVDVGIRDYTSNNDWTWVTAHTAGQVNTNWQRELFDLTNFGGINFLTGSKKIEIAYRLINTDPNIVADGWYIDDIAVDQDVIDTFPIPASDDMDGTVMGNLKWLPECSWAVSNEDNHTSNGSKAYTDSPGKSYGPNTDCSLNTDGAVDLTPYGGANTADPQLVFWDKYTLGGTTTMIKVEVAPIDNRTVWTPLTPQGSSNPWIAQGTATSSWTKETFDLYSLAGKAWFFRFRLVADGGTPADGWYIDDVVFRERPQDIVGLPYYEPFETATNWTLTGNWNLTTGSPTPHRSGATALTDSPTGTYIIPATSPSNTATLNSQINLSGTSAPKLEFWTYWDTNATVNLYLEMSRDNGLTWPAAQILWKHMYGDTNPPFSGGNYNTDLAWTRYVADLTPYACPTSCAPISLRFRLESLPGSTPADGWYIDDLSVTDSTVQVVAANAFQDDIESNVPTIGPSTNNWYAGGAWTIVSNVGHNNSKSWASQPSGNYAKPEDSILELVPTLDLTGVVNPILSFWNKYAVNSGRHFVQAEVSTNNGQTWTVLPWVATTGQPVVTTQSGLNMGWSRQQMDLSSYASGPSKQIRLRFRLKALTTDTSYQGWWLDDVYVGPRNTTGYPLSFGENFNSPTRWTMEGDWQTVNDFGPWHFDFPADNFTPVSDTYGGNSANTQWDASYYHYYTNASNFYPPGRPPNADLCGPNVGAQIGTVTPSGTTFVQGVGYVTTFSWSDGSPTGTVSNTDTGVVLDGAGNSFQFTVPADQNVRTLRLYFEVWQAKVTTTMTLSDGSAATYTNTYTKSSGATEGYYTATYAANSPNQTLTVNVKVNQVYSGNGTAELRAISLANGSPGAPQLSVPANFANSPASVNLTTEGTADWMHFGLTSDTDVNRKACVKSILNQSVGTINYSWSSTNIPGNGGGNAQWTTNALDWEKFYAVFQRKLVVNAGTYRFWLAADDGVHLLIDGTRIAPITTLPYPWTSPSANDYVMQGTTNYFYEATIGTTGQHTIEIDYFQGTGGATLRFQMAEKSNMLHSSAAAQNYTINQDTGAYLNSGINVPASMTLPTTISFYERFAIGSSAGNPDPIYVKTSTDGGFTWVKATVKTIAKDNGGATVGNQTVTYGYNGGDSPSVSPWVTYQNWQLHTIDLGTSATARFVNIKFELDSRVSTAPADGWYIDEITVTQ